MAYIVNTLTASTLGVTAASPEFIDWFVAQTSGDYILVVAHNDGGGTALSIDPGWTEVGGAAPSNSASRTGVWYRQHTGTFIDAPTITGTTDEWAVIAILIRDADPVDFLDVAAGITEQTGSTFRPACPSVTTTTDGCLILRIVGRDGSNAALAVPAIGNTITAAALWDNITSATTNATCIVDYHMQPAAGATGAQEYVASTSDGGRQMTLAIRNKSGGGISATPRQPVTMLLVPQGVTATLTDISTVRATIGGVATLASTLAQADQTETPDAPFMWMAHRRYNITTTAAIGMFGFSLPLDSTADLTGKLFYLHARVVSVTQLSSTGPLFYFEDALGGWATWRPFSRSTWNQHRRWIGDITAQPLVDDGGIDWTQVTRVGWIVHQVSATSGTRNTSIHSIAVIDPAAPPAITGGNSVQPASFRDIGNMVLSGNSYRLSQIQGAGQNLVAIPVQIGDGTNATFFRAEAQSLEYPRNGALVGENVPNLDAGIIIDASAADTIDLGSSILGTTRQQVFTIHADSSTSASYNFQGASIVGFLVTWKTGINCTGATFSKCGKVDGKGAAFDACTIKGGTDTGASLRLEGGGSATGCGFTAGSETYAIEIAGNGPITVNIAGSTFSGYTKPLNILGTTGTVTIQIAADDPVPTYDTAGATVVFDQPVVQATASVTGFTANSRIIVYNVTTDTEVLNTKVAGTSWSLNYDNGTTFTDGDIVDVFHVYFDASGNTASKKTRTRTVAAASGWGVLVNEETCTTYAAYVATYGVNGSTVTEFALDGVNLQFDLNDTDDSWFAHRLFAWDKFTMWDTGNRAFFQQITATDAGNLSIGSALLDNLRANTAKQADEINVVNATSTLPVVNPTTGGGGITMYSGGKVLTTSTGGIAPSEAQIKAWVRDELSAELARIDVAVSSRNAVAPDNAGIATIAATVSSGRVLADIRAVRGIEVNGTGTEADPWGP